MRPKQILHSTTIFINFEIYIITPPSYLEHNEREKKVAEK